MRKGWIIALAIFLLIIGVALGISVYNKNKTDNTNIVDNKKLAEENEINNVVPTAVVEEKVSPNAKVIQKQYFTGCDHLLKETKDIPENLVNKNKEEVEKYYKDWNVDSFSKNEIINGNNNAYNPLKNASRAETAVMLNRLIDFVEK